MNAQDDGREARLIPVAELLRSRDMSGVLLLKDEVAPLVGSTPAQPPSATPANINSDGGNSWDRELKLQRQRRELVNAARIALSLTRSFVFYMFPATPLSAEDALQQLSTLQLDDMFVNLEKNSVEGGDISPPIIEGEGGDCQKRFISCAQSFFPPVHNLFCNQITAATNPFLMKFLYQQARIMGECKH